MYLQLNFPRGIPSMPIAGDVWNERDLGGEEFELESDTSLK